MKTTYDLIGTFGDGRPVNTIACLNCAPDGVMCATSTLGCADTESELDLSFAEKLFATIPGKLPLCGKHDPIMEHRSDVDGVPYKVYPDAHMLYKRQTSQEWKTMETSQKRLQGVVISGAA